MADAKTLEDKLNREQLNELATSKGVENPEGFANKGVLAEKLEAEGVSDEELDKFVEDHTEADKPGEGDDKPEDDTTVAPAPGTNTEDGKTADDLNTLHEPGSIRDGSAANEDVTPKDEEHPDINANPGGRAETAGHGDTLGDENVSTPEQNAANGQATAERNGAEEAELHRAALDSGTSRESSTLDDQAAEGWKTARQNVAAEKKTAKANRETATTANTPADNSSK